MSPFLVLTLTATLSTLTTSRVVNISNTWVLPEEGFPVFYRYFRDRISWLEADAVCQFHHGNLVTAATTSQYDAIRAYLKELDVTQNVWIGLSRSSEKPNFIWTNYQPLGEAHWQLNVPIGTEPLCVAIDPTADFLWKPMSCGGPPAASFICELKVPDWALGPKGCLLTEVPSLTIIYIPEQQSLELTSDCGLDGTKRIACKGDADREELLKQLTCAIPSEDFEEKLNTVSPETSKTTKIWTSNTIYIDYGMPTRHRRETEDTLSPASTKSTTEIAAKPLKVSKANTPEVQVTSEATVTTEDDVPILSSLATEQPEASSEVNSEGYSSEATTGGFEEKDSLDKYAGAINQGTMFDIIEINETQTFQNEETEASTTAAFQKEPTVVAEAVTLKPTKKASKLKKTTKEQYKKELPSKKSTTPQPKNLSKEFVLDPILTGPMTPLNRTDRKELPEYDPAAVEVFKSVESVAPINNTTHEEVAKEEEASVEDNREELEEEEVSVSSTTSFGESLEPEPQAQPRPSRQRQLTRPQRRSFYPYFFSRVLG